MKKITVQKVSEEYLLTLASDDKHVIGLGVQVQIDGATKRLTITNAKGRREFIFDGSTPAMVERIGRLLVKASEMAEK